VSDHEGENWSGEDFTWEWESSTRRGCDGETAPEMVRREEVIGEIRELVETVVEKE
jgi:hypothetical protein